MNGDREILRERAFSHWLCNIEGIGRGRYRKLLQEAGSAEAVFAMEESRLARLLPAAQLAALLSSRKRADVEEEYRLLVRRGINCYPASDPLFPRRLLDIPDPPEVIYSSGRLPEESSPSVAVIGARICSEYGRYAARKFAGILAASGVNIISGLARGIDGISQEAAMDNGGYTCAVMGCGVDICYPAQNRSVYERVREQGGILSESPPGTLPRAGLFPQRNRIISGLADLVLVVEARERSGTLITVDMALEQGREVAVIPGRITDSLSSGCNRLLSQGAAPALKPEDILELLEQRKAQMTAGNVTGRSITDRNMPDGNAADRNITDSNTSGQNIFHRNMAEGKETEERDRAEERNASVRPEQTDLKRTVKNLLDYTPMTVSGIRGLIRERIKEGGGEPPPLPEVARVLLELVLEGSCRQEGGYFYLI